MVIDDWISLNEVITRNYSMVFVSLCSACIGNFLETMSMNRTESFFFVFFLVTVYSLYISGGVRWVSKLVYIVFIDCP